ncbi:MAG: transporter substrate-binding domain-containing protein [Pseudorhodoplanes sp.]
MKTRETPALITRRSAAKLITGAAAFGAFAAPAIIATPALAEDTLERLRKAKKVKVALPQQPPYSGLQPDGSVIGIAPTIVKLIMGRLGVPEIEGVVAPYGQLIPGVNPGRWDIIAACLTITKERCPSVAYADPIVSEGGIFIYRPADLPDPPKNGAEIASRGLKVVTSQGSYNVQRAVNAGVQQANIIQVPDTPAIFNTVATKRGDIGYSTLYGANNILKQYPDFKSVYPVSDDPPRGSSCAFRLSDKELHGAFQKELRAMKASGEFQKIAEQAGFPPVGQSVNVTAEEECARAS